MRTGIYAPFEVTLEKYERESGYFAMAQVFSIISGNKSKNNLQLMTAVSKEFEHRCYKDIDFNPVIGLFGYIIYKNFSKHTLE